MESRTLENRLLGETSFTNSQIAAIKFSVQLGRNLRKSLPQIADEFRNGKSLIEIAKDHNIAFTNDASEHTAMKAIRYALGGYHSYWNFLNEQDYEGLIPKNEYQGLVRQHRSDNNRKMDKKRRQKNQGIYGISKNQKALNGKKGAMAQIERKIGIHGKTYKYKQEVGKLGAQGNGFTLWTDEERLAALDMATQPSDAYRRGSRIARGKIAQDLNDFYHSGNKIRTAGAVSRFLNKYEKL